MIEVFYSSASLGALDTLAKTAGNKINPTLDNFMFTSDGGVVASDGETSVKVFIDPIEGKPQDFCVDAKLLMEVIKTLPHQPLRFEIEDLKLTIVHHTGKFELPIFPTSEYPQISFGEKGNTSIPSDKLLDIISKTSYSVANDELHPVMNGIYFDFPNFVATNRMRLIKYETDIKADIDPFILSPKPSSMLRQILSKESGDTYISLNGDSATFTTSRYVINAVLIEGNYPNYNSVIPTNNSVKVEVDRLTLMGALRRVGVMSPSATELVKLSIDSTESKMTITGQDLDLSTSAKESISCISNGNLEIGFKSSFAIEILRNVTSDNIVLELEGATRAALFKPQEESELTILLMPMMI